MDDSSSSIVYRSRKLRGVPLWSLCIWQRFLNFWLSMPVSSIVTSWEVVYRDLSSDQACQEQELRKMSKAMSTSTSQRMWWRRRKRTWTRSWARWIREELTISCPGWHSSVYEFSTTTTATRISSNVDYQFCHYHSLIAISIHLATHHQK